MAKAEEESPRSTQIEVLFAFVLATFVAALLFRLSSIPFVRSNLHAMVAGTFIALPAFLLRKRGGIEKYGFTTDPLGLGLKVFLGFSAVILPLFVVGFVAYHKGMCAWAPKLVAGSCFRVVHPIFRLPRDFLSLAAAQVIVVALPEELFFRGYMQGRLEELWPPTKKFLGAPIGKAWLVTAILFGLGHFFVTFEPGMLTRAIPGLAFGWMFSRTRSLLAGTLFHATCNLLMETMVLSYLTT